MISVVDSSAWLEYVADGPNAKQFAKPIQNAPNLIVPSITLLEVFKRILQQRDENSALKVIAVMRQGRVVDLDSELALSAAKLGADLKLPLADSIILATVRRYRAVLWTQDSDFEGLDDVRYFAKR